jgi:hypothetical protein
MCRLGKYLNTHKETYTDSGHVPTEEVFIVFFGERLMFQ